MVTLQLVTILLAVAFAYQLFTKLRSRHTIALHRHPQNLRRKPFEPATWTDTTPHRVVLYTNIQKKKMLTRINWSDVF